ncbi:ATP-binding protein [Kineosporia babensis]|uniref:Tetratricopeptide repeat protein n=1 Tax=Kineosporia babensis TaxID=499548 RepID=A0A9X1NJA5_9ACTN|nr:tetratricopeptide repeat protein [Kineosporia babensis]
MLVQTDLSTAANDQGPFAYGEVAAPPTGVLPTGRTSQLSAALPVPQQMPIQSANFVGRVAELERLDHALTDYLAGAAPSVVAICALAGAAGVGKTALALQWAHRAREHFPDGSLYVNLRGFGPGKAILPGEVLDEFLRSMGVEAGRIPRELDAKAALYRSLLDGRRMLVVLDNARNSYQVRPLLPGSSSSFVVVTSRNNLTGLVAKDGATRIVLKLLDMEAALALLIRLVGSSRVNAEPRMAEEIIFQCGYLPLALQIAGQRASTEPDLSLRELVTELADERDRLDLLHSEDDDMGLRTTFSWSYKALPDDTARLFRRLGLHFSGEFPINAAAALGGVTPGEARRHLNALAELNLLERLPSNRFRFHDLVRYYAAERAQDEESDSERQEALARCLAWYLHAADAANRSLMPQRRKIDIQEPSAQVVVPDFEDAASALIFCHTERSHLLQATQYAHLHGKHDVAWQIPVVLWSYFSLNRLLDDWIASHDLGLTSARSSQDVPGQGWTLNSLGNAYRELKDYDRAIECWREALELRRRTGDRYGEGTSLNNLANAYRRKGEYELALRYSKRALKIHIEVDDQWNQAIDLNSIGNTYRALDDQVRALESWEEALRIQSEIGDDFGVGKCLSHIGLLQLDQERYREAVTTLVRAMDIQRRISDRSGQGVTALGLGTSLLRLGLVQTSVEWLELAVATFERLGDQRVTDARELLASAGRGQPLR